MLERRALIGLSHEQQTCTRALLQAIAQNQASPFNSMSLGHQSATGFPSLTKTTPLKHMKGIW